MKRYVTFLLVYASLPLWVALVWLMVLARGSVEGFLLGSPFAVALSIPYCLATTAIALGTIYVHRTTSGSLLRRRLIALAFLLPSTTVVLGYVFYQMAESRSTEKAQKSEEALVLDYVRKSDVVLKEQGGQVLSLQLASGRVGVDRTAPREYRVYISSPKPMYASVLVKGRIGDPPEVTLNCVYLKEPDSGFVHPCK